MITLEHDYLKFRFPEVHDQARCSIEFQRTLRIPDDDKDYPLPPGLGCFPLRHLDDYAARLPAAWSCPCTKPRPCGSASGRDTNIRSR